MLSFASDYIEGTHEKILEKMMEINRESMPGYGEDEICNSAKEKIKKACACEDAEVYFLVGGTQTNTVMIDALTGPCEGIVAAETGHINVHEAGAIEYTGHKVLTIPEHEGKMHADELEDYLKEFYEDDSNEHMVCPGMVYISHPTEFGTLYSAEEIKSISKVCREYQIPLYLDGARLGYGLEAEGSDVTLPMIAEYCDAFYIGGTKVGALFGEAVVFTKHNTPKHFVTMIKQHGAMLAKGWLLGVQFDTLFTDDLYFKISRHAIEAAESLKKILREDGLSFFIDSPTNQQFVILENTRLEKLKKFVNFSIWQKYDASHTVVRFATSWSTTDEGLQQLKNILKENK